MPKSIAIPQDKRWGLIIIPVAVGLITAVGVSLGRPVGSLSHIYLYLLVVMIAAFWWGLGLALYAFILSTVAVIYFFVPPRGTLILNLDKYSYTTEFLGLGVFLVLSVFMAYLINALKRERDRAQSLAESERVAKETVIRTSQELERQRQRSDFLQKARRWLGDTIEPETVLQQVLEELVEVVGGKVLLVRESEVEEADSSSNLRIWTSGYSEFQPAEIERWLAEADLMLPLRSGKQLLGWLAYTFEIEIKPANTGYPALAPMPDNTQEVTTSTIYVLAEYLAASFETGKLYHTLEFQSKEIAQLLRNSLRSDSALNRRADQLSIFYRLSAAIISGVAKPDLMAIALSEAARVLNCTAGAIVLVNQGTQQLELVARRGTIQMPEGQQLPVNEGPVGYVLKTAQPFVSNQFNRDSQPYGGCTVLSSSTEPVYSSLYVPIRSEGEIFGVVVVGAALPDQYGQEELDFLSGLASLLAMALVTYRYNQERERAASVEERNRIARDLHDGLAQSINYIGLKTQLIQELYQAGETQQIPEEIGRIAKVAERARDDVREVLYGLRHTERDRSLLVALTDLVHNLADTGQINATLVTNQKAEWPALSVATQIQLLRIVQEALANVQKHSGAAQVGLEAGYNPSTQLVQLRICDNGVGFVPEEVRSGGGQHLGLKIMRERAARLPAQLKVKSQPGQGTEIVVEYHLKEAELDKENWKEKEERVKVEGR